MELTIKFDPKIDTVSEVQAAIAAAYGNAQTATLTPATPSATSGDTDAGDTATTATHDNTGLPWDARIHSTPATMTSKGVWRKRKGVEDITVAAVEAELRGTPAPAAAAGPAPSAPPAPQMPAIQQPAAPATYQQLVELIGANLHTAANPAGRITDDWVKQALAHYGVTNGDLPNVANMAPESQLQILQGFKQSLGIQ